MKCEDGDWHYEIVDEPGKGEGGRGDGRGIPPDQNHGAREGGMEGGRVCVVVFWDLDSSSSSSSSSSIPTLSPFIPLSFSS